MNKEKWEKLILQIIPFHCDDVITASELAEDYNENLDTEWGD